MANKTFTAWWVHPAWESSSGRRQETCSLAPSQLMTVLDDYDKMATKDKAKNRKENERDLPITNALSNEAGPISGTIICPETESDYKKYLKIHLAYDYVTKIDNV